ncbi:hypothetical protein EZV62_008266 [Acer yangbiense]|uniref:Uncharacterized protein n=1 Tax=Acer yangbiense TaxID=1000413 RepID=A0A5C7ICW7_9ROSI|nr:hypothetical protein EZV62_008266 [Acer yangbiense]
MLIQDDSSYASSFNETSPPLSTTSSTQELPAELVVEQPPPSNATTDNASHVEDPKNLFSRPTRIRRPPTYLQDYATLATQGETKEEEQQQVDVPGVQPETVDTEETEMPNKKPKLTNSNEEGEGYDQFYKSIFSSQAQVRDMEAKVSQQSRSKIDSKWKDYLSEDDEELRTSQPTMNNALLLNGEITRLKMT